MCYARLLFGTNQRTELETLNIQSEQQQLRDDNLQLANLHSSAICANCLRTTNLLYVAYGTRDFQHSFRTAATKRRQFTTRQSPLVFAVCKNCLRTANFLFMAYGTRLRFSILNQKKQQQRDDDLRSPLMSAVYANSTKSKFAVRT